MRAEDALVWCWQNCATVLIHLQEFGELHAMLGATMHGPPLFNDEVRAASEGAGGWARPKLDIVQQRW